MNPRIALLGNGRAGKDTAGGWLGLFTPLRYVGSTSRVICPLIAKDLGITPEEAWAGRHANRKYWYDWANEYRKDDATKLARACLESGDIVVGLRADYELAACTDVALFDLVVWVENPRVPPDPTVTFTSKDCDIIIVNDGELPAFYDKLRALCRFSRIHVDPRWNVWDGPTVDDDGNWLGPLSRQRTAV